MHEVEVEEAQAALPEWAQSTPDTRIITYDMDTLILLHPDHAPYVWTIKDREWRVIESAFHSQLYAEFVL